jgi:hypothetical protein
LDKCLPLFILRIKNDNSKNLNKFLSFYENTDDHIQGLVSKAMQALSEQIAVVAEFQKILIYKCGLDDKIDEQISLVISGYCEVFSDESERELAN